MIVNIYNTSLKENLKIILSAIWIMHCNLHIGYLGFLKIRNEWETKQSFVFTDGDTVSVRSSGEQE